MYEIGQQGRFLMDALDNVDMILERGRTLVVQVDALVQSITGMHIGEILTALYLLPVDEDEEDDDDVIVGVRYATRAGSGVYTGYVIADPLPESLDAELFEDTTQISAVVAGSGDYSNYLILGSYSPDVLRNVPQNGKPAEFPTSSLIIGGENGIIESETDPTVLKKRCHYFATLRNVGDESVKIRFKSNGVDAGMIYYTATVF